MPGFNEIWAREPVVRLGKLSTSINVLHGTRIRMAYGSMPPLSRVPPASAPVSFTQTTVDIELDRITNPQELHPAYGVGAPGPHDRWEYEPLERNFLDGRRELVAGRRWLERDVGVWPLSGRSWQDVEEAQRELSTIFAGRNHFEPDSPDMVMDIISRQRVEQGGIVFMDGFDQYAWDGGNWANQSPAAPAPKPNIPKPSFIGARGPRPLNLDGE